MTPDSPGFLGNQPNVAAVGRTEHPVMATSSATTIETPILLDAAPDAPEAIDSGWNPGRIAQRRTRWGSLGLATIGATIIFGTWLLLSAVASIIGFFSISAIAGGLALTLYLGGVGLLFYAVARELLSLRELHQVDALRAALNNSTTDVEQARALCKAWLIRLAQRVPDAISVADALGEAIDTAQLRALVHNRLDSQLSAVTRRIGIKAASQARPTSSSGGRGRRDRIRGPGVASRGRSPAGQRALAETPGRGNSGGEPCWHAIVSARSSSRLCVLTIRALNPFPAASVSAAWPSCWLPPRWQDRAPRRRPICLVGLRMSRLDRSVSEPIWLDCQHIAIAKGKDTSFKMVCITTNSC